MKIVSCGRFTLYVIDKAIKSRIRDRVEEFLSAGGGGDAQNK
jgi:hypothetical protein